MHSPNNSWQNDNLANIKSRLAAHLPETNLAKIFPSQVQGVFVRRIEDSLELYCFDRETQALSDIMSRIVLDDPLKLVATYNQVMFLTQIWSGHPLRSAYIAGFGGGRLGMLLHHFNEAMKIDGSDFDQAIIDVAESHFGVSYDQRYSIRANDSGADFDSRQGTYDIVLIDVFSNSGSHASHLASHDFFKRCNTKMSEHGVLAINLIERDEEREAKIQNLQSVFPYVTEWQNVGSHLLFASRTEQKIETLIARAKEFEFQSNIDFPFSEHAKALRCVQPGDYPEMLRERV